MVNCFNFIVMLRHVIYVSSKLTNWHAVAKRKFQNKNILPIKWRWYLFVSVLEIIKSGDNINLGKLLGVLIDYQACRLSVDYSLAKGQ